MGWDEAKAEALLGPERWRLAMGLSPAPAVPESLDHASPEGRLLGKIRQEATRAGWLVYHTHNSKRSDPGFPDLVLTKPGRLIFAELKRASQKPTQEQHCWLDVLRHSVEGVEVYLWHPSDYPAIVAILAQQAPLSG